MRDAYGISTGRARLPYSIVQWSGRIICQRPLWKTGVYTSTSEQILFTRISEGSRSVLQSPSALTVAWLDQGRGEQDEAQQAV